MNTTTAIPHHESKNTPAIETIKPSDGQQFTRAETKRYTSVALVANMLSEALQKGVNEMFYTLVLVTDTGLLDFDDFLQGRSWALMVMCDDLSLPIARAFSGRHDGEYADMLSKGNLSLSAETEIYRKISGEINDTPEKMQYAEETLSKLHELYAQVECFMRAVDSYGEDSPKIKRASAPRFVPAPTVCQSAA